MASPKKLVKKLNRRAKWAKIKTKGFDNHDKMSQSEEKMAKSKGAYALDVKIQRRLDRNFGIDTINYEPKISKRVKASVIERYDFGGSDYGIRLTLGAGLISDIKLQPGDIVRVLSGNLKGHYLEVASLIDATHVRLEDSLAMADAGAAEVTKVTTIADVSGSLDGKYFVINSAADATSYYVWLDVDAGGNDPLVAGKTAIPVSIASDDSAEVIAAAIQAAVDAETDFSASVGGDEVLITNAAVGVTTDSADGDSGFTIETTVQGSAANATLSENNVHCRFQLSDVKASYK